MAAAVPILRPAVLLGHVGQLMLDPQCSHLLDLTLVGRNGKVLCPNLLLRSLCPFLLEQEGPWVIIFPDSDRDDLEHFIQSLVSHQGPVNHRNLESFVSLLAQLGLEGGMGLEPSWQEDDPDSPLCSLDESTILANKIVESSCHICGLERKSGRALRQHLVWHQKNPTMDYTTCHICPQCGKVCASHNARKLHERQGISNFPGN